MKPQTDASVLYRNPVRLLQRLIQFDTTNPPGNERECIAFVSDLLAEAGIESTILGKAPERPNLVARLPGQGSAPPLLLYGHLDVVTTEGQQWTHPPFAGEEADGFIWGRGALDMKGGVAMMLAAFLRAKYEGLSPRGDLILTLVSDEEAGGDFGARYLVENHPELFSGVRYAIGEFGGFTLYAAGRRFYPIMVAEKQICWMKATVHGPGGHGSMPVRGGAMAKLGRLLLRLDRARLPVHVTPAARLMIEGMASAMGGISGRIFRQLTNPRLADAVLKLLGERGRVFHPLLHNTVSPTILHGSSKINVIPARASVELDGRVLPGYGPDDMVRELRRAIGGEVDIEVIRFDPGPEQPDMGLFPLLADILRQTDPEGIPVPFLLPGVTDARFFSKLGIQTYGYLPMVLPEDFNFMATIHGADERIPAETVSVGANAIYALLKRYGS